MRGSVIVSLRNMNRVLEINEERGYAVVEPGVRWFDLYEAIKAGDHRLMLSIADLGWGGVVGNTLDHGATYMPYGVDMGMQCGMEVVLADGDGHAHRHGRACPTTSPGTSTSAASGRRRTSSSCSPTTGSSPRWASG